MSADIDFNEFIIVFKNKMGNEIWGVPVGGEGQWEYFRPIQTRMRHASFLAGAFFPEITCSCILERDRIFRPMPGGQEADRLTCRSWMPGFQEAGMLPPVWGPVASKPIKINSK